MENYLNYIDKFASETDVQTAVENGELVKPYVAYIEDEDRIDWNSKKTDYSKQYLTFEMITDGELRCNCNANYFNYPFSIEYRINNGDWETLTLFTSFTEYSISNNLKIGDKISFKGNREQYGYDVNSGFKIFGKGLELYNVYGNIMSMIYGDNFIGQTLLPNKSYIFSRFFNSTNLFPGTKFGVVSAENLILPATTLQNYCYLRMFYGCTALITAPELPATTLASNCYNSMFYNCSSLNYIKCLATDISASGCTSGWVSGVASSGTFVKAATMTGWSTGNSGIPNNWTVQDAS